MEEIWKDIKGYEGYYQASNLGNVRSLHRLATMRLKNGLTAQRVKKGRILKQTLDGRKNYLQVSLNKNGVRKVVSVHRLVAMTFLPNPMGLPEVNHKDEIKTNNCVENLEWCTHKYNNTYGSKLKASLGENNGMARLTEEKVRKIIEMKNKGLTLREVGEVFGISGTHVCAICKGRRWEKAL